MILVSLYSIDGTQQSFLTAVYVHRSGTKLGNGVQKKSLVLIAVKNEQQNLTERSLLFFFLDINLEVQV